MGNNPWLRVCKICTCLIGTCSSGSKASKSLKEVKLDTLLSGIYFGNVCIDLTSHKLLNFNIQHCSSKPTHVKQDNYWIIENTEMCLTSLKFIEALFVIMWWVVSCLWVRFTTSVAVSFSGGKPMTFYNPLSNSGLSVICLSVSFNT